MAQAEKDTIEIKEREMYDGRKKLIVYELHCNSSPQAIASAHQQLNGSVMFRFNPIGAFHLQEASVWVEGLLQLMVRAQELEHGKKK